MAFSGKRKPRTYLKGCNCKRSGCLKNYCECYASKKLCCSMCKCFGCRNVDLDMDPINPLFLNSLTTESAKASNDNQLLSYDNLQIRNGMEEVYTKFEYGIQNVADSSSIMVPNIQYNSITSDDINNIFQYVMTQVDGGEKNSLAVYQRGCNCKKSGCLKYYCDCYAAKTKCSSNCCQNIDIKLVPANSELMTSIACAPIIISNENQPANYDISPNNFEGSRLNEVIEIVKDENQFENVIDISENRMTMAESQECNVITLGVVNTAVECMITQAIECEKNGLTNVEMQKMVLQEFGKCLVEVIDFSMRNMDIDYTQD
ncbi:tombola isoform X2 [Haematobia irritans]|uniref:tombola isoform X2 n=1 Tax=Haematobia irritans TaxID=7368 RepID=UPI003F502C3E